MELRCSGISIHFIQIVSLRSTTFVWLVKGAPNWIQRRPAQSEALGRNGQTEPRTGTPVLASRASTSLVAETFFKTVQQNLSEDTERNPSVATASQHRRSIETCFRFPNRSNKIRAAKDRLTQAVDIKVVAPADY
jgi:hypothetical protein